MEFVPGGKNRLADPRNYNKLYYLLLSAKKETSFPEGILNYFYDF